MVTTLHTRILPLPRYLYIYISCRMRDCFAYTLFYNNEYLLLGHYRYIIFELNKSHFNKILFLSIYYLIIEFIRIMMGPGYVGHSTDKCRISKLSNNKRSSISKYKCHRISPQNVTGNSVHYPIYRTSPVWRVTQTDHQEIKRCPLNNPFLRNTDYHCIYQSITWHRVEF